VHLDCAALEVQHLRVLMIDPHHRVQFRHVHPPLRPSLCEGL
jgi:hypothetical protein